MGRTRCRRTVGRPHRAARARGDRTHGGYAVMNTRPFIVGALTLVVASCAIPPAQRAGLDRIEHVIVIYAENRSFDNLYGLFPGANGIANATPEQYTQVDRDGRPLPELPPAWKGREVDQAFPWKMPNK